MALARWLPKQVRLKKYRIDYGLQNTYKLVMKSLVLPWTLSLHLIMNIMNCTIVFRYALDPSFNVPANTRDATLRTISHMQRLVHFTEKFPWSVPILRAILLISPNPHRQLRLPQCTMVVRTLYRPRCLPRSILPDYDVAD